jgi:acyl carrier protein
MATTTSITREQIESTVHDLLLSIAPEAEMDTLNPTVDMREALDIDSFDFLNFLIALDEELGVEIPESDYGTLISLNDLVEYLEARL